MRCEIGLSWASTRYTTLVSTHSNNNGTAVHNFIFISGTFIACVAGRQTWKYEKGPVALYAVKGRRDSMEDRFSIVTEQSRWGLNLFGIFDGHGGKVL